MLYSHAWQDSLLDPWAISDQIRWCIFAPAAGELAAAADRAAAVVAAAAAVVVSDLVAAIGDGGVEAAVCVVRRQWCSTGQVWWVEPSPSLHHRQLIPRWSYLGSYLP